MKRLNVLLVGLAAMCLCVGAAAADHRGHGPMGGPGPMGGEPGRLIPLLLHADNLSADQQQKMQAIMSADRDAVHTLFGQLRDANKQLADKLLSPDAPQTADLTPIVQNIAQLRSQLTQHELSTVLAIRGVLTPDQLAKAAARHTQLQQLHQQMHDLVKSPQ